MRQQRQSETVKKGSGSSHDKAVANVARFLRKKEVETYTEWYETFNPKFNAYNKLRADYGHSYDIVARKEKHHVAYGPLYYIEIDGEKHSKTNQQINDGIAEKYIKEVLKHKIIRLDKRECLGDLEDRENYLYNKLGDLLLD